MDQILAIEFSKKVSRLDSSKFLLNVESWSDTLRILEPIIFLESKYYRQETKLKKWRRH